MRLERLAAATLIAVAGVAASSAAAPSDQLPVAAAAVCTPSVGPSIAPPASVPAGIPGFHAAWYGQSGYPTLCPGQISRAVVAYYNSGSLGWAVAPNTAAYLGTWNPEPGQDQPSVIGGNGTHGSPNTRWTEYNRPATLPVIGRYGTYVGPGQVAWFQFTVKAPPVPGTYRLYIRPLIEGVQWMEDYGVYWQITVVPAGTTTCTITSGPYANPTGSNQGGGSAAQPFIDYDVPSGTYCYRAGAHNQTASATAFAYTTPLSMPSPPEPVSHQPTSLDARVSSTACGSASTFDDRDVSM